jgi:hypothetical protein
MDPATRELLNSPLGIALGLVVGSVVTLILVYVWDYRYNRRKIRQGRREFELLMQRWDLRDRLQDMRDQIREERMSESQRELHRHIRAEAAEIDREARRRLGLPSQMRRADGMKYRLQYLPDPWRIVIHTDFSLAKWSYIRSRGFHVSKEDPTDPQLSDDLLEIPGVVYVQIEPYQAEVGIGRLFSFGDLLPSILEILRGVAGPFALPEEVQPPIEPPSTVEFICPHCGFHKPVERPRIDFEPRIKEQE